MLNMLMIPYTIYYSYIKIDANTQRSNWMQAKENIRLKAKKSP